MDGAMRMMQVDQNRDKTGYIMIGPKNLVKEVRERIKQEEPHQVRGLGDQGNGEMEVARGLLH